MWVWNDSLQPMWKTPFMLSQASLASKCINPKPEKNLQWEIITLPISVFLSRLKLICHFLADTRNHQWDLRSPGNPISGTRPIGTREWSRMIIRPIKSRRRDNTNSNPVYLLIVNIGLKGYRLKEHSGVLTFFISIKAIICLSKILSLIVTSCLIS